MTPMNNADYLTRLEHADELESLKAAKRASGLTYEQLAELIGVNKVWLASVFEGQQYVPEEYTLKLAEALKISPSATAFLNSHPYKGNTDPILYRLHEVIDTYGPAIKDIIHEQGGNAIMSAIDFGLDVDVTEDAEGNHRVIIKFDGKLLPYAKKGKYPWYKKSSGDYFLLRCLNFLFYLFRLHTKHMTFLVYNIIFLSVFLKILIILHTVCRIDLGIMDMKI